MNDTERLNELEIKLAEQDKMIEEISEVLSTQYDKIDMLEAKIGRLMSKIEDSGAGNPETPVDRPPHY